MLPVHLMLTTGVLDRMKTGNGTTDAVHPMIEKDPNCRGSFPHDLVNEHRGLDKHGRLH